MRNANRLFASVTGLTVLLGGLLLIIPFYSEVAAINQKKPEDVRVVNGPEMPASVNVENKPIVRARQRGNWTVNVENTPTVKITNGPDMPVFVTKRKEPFISRCFSTIPTESLREFCNFSPEPPTDKLFLIKYVNAFVSDRQGADVQYRMEILSSFDGSTMLHFIPRPTVQADASERGFAVVTEKVLSGHEIGGVTNLRLQISRNSGNQVGQYQVTVTGFLVDRT